MPSFLFLNTASQMSNVEERESTWIQCMRVSAVVCGSDRNIGQGKRRIA
jgi:hypothetical protein